MSKASKRWTLRTVRSSFLAPDQREFNRGPRMRLVVCGAIGVAFVPSSAIAAKFNMQLSAGPQQVSKMQSGVAAVDDTTASSSVRLIQAEGDLKKRGQIQLLVMNHGDKPFNFGPENVSAKLADGTQVA